MAQSLGNAQIDPAITDVDYAPSAIAFSLNNPVQTATEQLSPGVYRISPTGIRTTVADGTTYGTASFSGPKVSGGLTLFSTFNTPSPGLYLYNVTVPPTTLFNGADVAGVGDIALEGSTIAFQASLNSDPPSQSIVTGIGFQQSLVAYLPFEAIFKSFREVALAGGRVSFIAENMPPPGVTDEFMGVYANLGSFGVHRTIADWQTPIPGGTGNFTNFEDLNAAAGVFAFRGFGADGQEGIYAEIAGQLRKIADLTTPIKGRLPTGFTLGSDGIDGNQIAFVAHFEDGSSSICLATISLQNFQTVTAGLGLEYNNINFGAQPLPGEIHGVVYNDLGRNGVRDISDTPLAGWTVFLDKNNNGTLNAGEVSTVSDANGQYAFTGLTPFVTYNVVEQPPAGWTVTAPQNAKWVVPLSPAQVVVGDDFGNFQGTTGGGAGNQGVLRGKLFGDTNGNGTQDGSEAGMAGWTVYLDANNNGTMEANELRVVSSVDNLATLGVNEAGNYQFTGLAGGNYIVRIVQQPGYAQASPVGNALAPLPNRTTGVQPQQGAAGDFNGDGFADLVVPNSGSNDLTIFTNNGAGFLNPGQTILFASPGIANGPPQVGYSPAASVVGDFNNDGKADIAVPNIDSTNVAILLNTTAVVGGTPSFSISTIATKSAGENFLGPTGLTTGDFNRDGFLDIAVAAEYSDKVVILLNRPSAPGSFVLGSAVAVGDAPVAIVALQLNDDNSDGQLNSLDFLDLAVTSYTGNTVTLLRGSASGTFTVQGGALATGTNPSAIVSGDFNQDGRPDLAVANLISTSVTVFLHSNSDFGFTSPHNYPLSGTSNAASLVAVDMDRDGNLDLAVSTGATARNAKVYILHNQGSGQFVPLSDVSVGSGTLNTLLGVFIAAADLDHDARQTPDLIVINGLSNTVTVLNNTLTLGAYQLAIGGIETIGSLNFGLQTSVAAAQVVDRRVFYNRSKFDGNDAAANAADDGAIATNKTALLPGGTAKLANYTSYNRGLNGLMIDVSNLAGTPTVADFTFRTGNDNSPNAWAAAPAPQSIVVRPNAGQGGSSRIELIWADGAIKKTWLQVTLLGTANTGLTQPDVFYFGNAVGEAGNASSNARVNATDELLARDNPHSFDDPVPIDYPYDYDRDGFVNATDQILSRSNGTTLVTGLKLISPPAALSASALSEPGQALSLASEPLFDEHASDWSDPSANALPASTSSVTPFWASSLRQPQPQPVTASRILAIHAALSTLDWSNPQVDAHSQLSPSLQLQLRPATGRRVANRHAAESAFTTPHEFDID